MYTGHQDAQWQPFFHAVQRKLSKQAFETWFRPLRLQHRPQERVLQIAAPNTVVRDWILSKYSDALEQSLAESRLGSLRVEWATDPVDQFERPTTNAPEIEVGLASTNAHRDGADLSLSEFSSLNSNYTFDNFVVASCNRLAHAAAMAIADSPGKTYNPLYLYGGVGLGKTHLIQAIGHAIRAATPTLRIAYLSLERFMNELISAIRFGYDKTNAFRERYRGIDV